MSHRCKVNRSLGASAHADHTTDDPHDGPTVLPPDDGTSFRITFVATEAAKVLPNRMHLELTSESLAQQQATVYRALALGGRHVDVGQLPEEEHVVLGDLDGNE